MKIGKLISAVLAAAMLITMIPAAAIAQERDEVITGIHYYGDANLNDYINTLDATMILKICAELEDPTVEQMTMTYELIRKIDANKDGKLNTADAAFDLQVAAGMRDANEYYDTASGNPPTVEPTVEPTNQPTSQPTGEPTNQPTTQPTAEPTAEPTEEPDAYITVNVFDEFNEVYESCQMGVYEGENVITAENIKLPAGKGYQLSDPDFSVTVTVEDGEADPDVIDVVVIPKAKDDAGHIYKVIYNVTGFNKVNEDLSETAYYALGADINLEGENRLPFGWSDEIDTEDEVFYGIFHGNGHMIYNVCIDHTWEYDEETETYTTYENVGLFSQNAGTICNLIVFTSAGFRTTEYGVYGDSNVGIIAGQNGGLIKDCYVFGNVGALDCFDDTHGAAGGICGVNYGIVSRCSFEGGAEGFYWIGGIVGKNAGRISESYFAGGINVAVGYDIVYDYRIKYIGGICGGSEGGDIRNCYVYCSSTISGYSAVGGMIGWLKGGHFHNSFIVKSRVDYIAEDGGHDDIGVLVSTPFFSGLYFSNTETMPMKPEFGSEWDMNGASHSTFPDLVNHRRFDKFYID